MQLSSESCKISGLSDILTLSEDVGYGYNDSIFMKGKNKRGRVGGWKAWVAFFIGCLFSMFVGGLIVLKSDFKFASFETYDQTRLQIKLLSHLENNEVEEAKSYIIEYLANQYEQHSDPNRDYFWRKFWQTSLVPFHIERAAKSNPELEARIKKIQEELGVKSYYERHGISKLISNP